MQTTDSPSGFAASAGRAAGRSLKPLIRRCTFVGSIVRVSTERPVIVLTYDDGPDPLGTTAVLEALEAKRASATFFVLLTRVRRHPRLLDDILAAGHEIGLHGLDHQRLSSLPYGTAKRRLRDGKAELEDLTGQLIRWMRPPYGAQTFATWHAIRTSNLEPVMWNRTTWDSRNVSQEERVAMATQRPISGTILLAHDGFAGEADGVGDGPEPTVDRGQLTTLILEEFQARGLSGCSLEAALEQGTAVREGWFTRKEG